MGLFVGTQEEYDALMAAAQTVGRTWIGDTPSLAPDTQTVSSLNATHPVKKGDTLWKIAREHYGLDPSDTKAIQNAVNHIIDANNGRLSNGKKFYDLREGANANYIFPGQEIKLPPESTLADEPKTKLDWDKLREGGKIQYLSPIEAKVSAAQDFKSAVLPEKLDAVPTPALRPDGPPATLAL